MLDQRAILSPMEQERWLARRLAELFDSADEYGVVAASMSDFVGDLETGAATMEQRSTASTRMPVQSGETVDRPRRKAVGKIKLAGRQNIDDMMASLAKSHEVVRGVVQAPEYQRWIQRHCRKRIHSQPDRVAVRIDRGNNGYPGRKAPQGVAQAAILVLILNHQMCQR